MTKSRLIAPVLLLLLLAGFALGVIFLFQLRFNAGDIYPPYSSLRADPLGTKVLYESLQEIPHLSISRFFQASDKLKGGKGRELILCGVDHENLRHTSEGDFKAIQQFLFDGGRVVIALLPNAAEDSYSSHLDKQRAKAKTFPHEDTNDLDVKSISIFEKYGVHMKTEEAFDPASSNRAVLAESLTATAGLPASVSWHSPSYFTEMDAHWRTIYQRGKNAVVIERSFGAGSLVMASDSYLFSNEALRRERLPALLAWFMGGRPEILFDETHLGVQEHPGVAALMRRYHLQGVLLGFFFVALLFVWQNSAPFVPPFPEESSAGQTATVQGRESTAGFASLLRRSILPADILPVGFAEWKAACARQPRAAARLAEIEALMQIQNSLRPGLRQPVETWQKIHRLLNERK